MSHKKKDLLKAASEMKIRLSGKFIGTKYCWYFRMRRIFSISLHVSGRKHWLLSTFALHSSCIDFASILEYFQSIQMLGECEYSRLLLSPFISRCIHTSLILQEKDGRAENIFWKMAANNVISMLYTPNVYKFSCVYLVTMVNCWSIRQMRRK